MSQFTTRPEIAGTFGVCTSTHWLASAAGMGILERGGNAFDAAVACGFALQVVEPHNNGPGGEVPIMLCPADSNKVTVICGQGPAPAAASIDKLHALGVGIMPGTGLLSAVVPGAFDAWMLMLRDYGTLHIRDVLAPAIGYARNGYPLADATCAVVEGIRPLLLEEWTTSVPIYLPGGETPSAGSLFRNDRLADTYIKLLREAESVGSDREAQIEAARHAWYKGFVADAIDVFCRSTQVMDTSGQRHFGLLCADDLGQWQASKESPVSLDYENYRVFKTGPWGQGPVFLQQLALLKGFDISAMDPRGAEFVHTVTECAKLAFADREAFYGDPNFVDVPLETLLSRRYNDARRALVSEDASVELRPGVIDGFGGPLNYRAAGSTQDIAYADALSYGEPTAVNVSANDHNGAVERLRASRGDTCHLDVIDAQGNMVAATPSGGWLQASPVIPTLGWGLSARGEMFSLDAATPASLAPRKRPRTTLTPSLAFRDGEPYMVFGTPGGDQQDQWSLHAFLHHVHHDLNLQASIEAPEFHTKHVIDSFFPRETRLGHLAVEGGFTEQTLTELKRRGHELEIYGDWTLGYVSAASRERDLLKAAASPRFMMGYALGR